MCVDKEQHEKKRARIQTQTASFHSSSNALSELKTSIFVRKYFFCINVNSVFGAHENTKAQWLGLDSFSVCAQAQINKCKYTFNTHPHTLPHTRS